MPANYKISSNNMTKLDSVTITDIISAPARSEIIFTNPEQSSWVLGSSEGNVQVTNTTTETALASYTIPGGLLDPGDRLRLVLMGDFVSVTDAHFTTLRVKFGSTTVLANPANQSVTVNAAARRWRMEVDLLSISTSNQQVGALIMMNIANAASLNSIGGAAPFSQVGRNGCAEDTSVDKTLAVTIQMVSTAPDISWDCRASFVEIMKKR